MYAQRSSVKDCFSFLSLDEDILEWPAGKPFFVDVGGGTGQQCIALRERWPEMKSRIVLQDLPSLVNKVQVPEGIDVMAYDFFTKQPVIGKISPDMDECQLMWNRCEVLLPPGHLARSRRSKVS